MSEDDALAAELGLELPVAPAAAVAPKILEAHIVPESKFARRTGRKIGSFPLTASGIRKRDRVYTDVQLLKDKKYIYGRLSDRERKLVNLVIKGAQVKKAAEEIGVSESTAHRYLKRPFVKAYIEQMRQRTASAANLTPEKVADVLSRAADGDETIKPQQLTAASIAARLLAPPSNAKGGTSITVNQQNNYNGVGASPFAGVESKDMLDTLAKNLLEMQPAADETPSAAPGPA